MRLVGTILILAGLGLTFGGTPWGMLKAFNNVANNPAQPRPDDLAKDIARAFNLSLVGIPVGIVGVACYVLGGSSQRLPEDDGE